MILSRRPVLLPLLLVLTLACTAVGSAAADEYYYGIFQPTSSFSSFCGGGCVAGLSMLAGPTDAFARVGIGLDPSIALVESVLAILKAGGAYVPLDPDFPQQRLRTMLEDTRAPIVLTDRTPGDAFENTGVWVMRLDDERAAIDANADDDLACRGTALDEAYAHPAEAARRGLAGAHRVEQLYRPGTAAETWIEIVDSSGRLVEEHSR